MRINTSQISMDASAEHKDVTGKSGQIRTTKREGEPEFQLRLPGMAGLVRERVEENRQGQQLCATSSVQCSEGEREYETTADQIIEKMVREISGQRVRLRRISGMGNGENVILSTPINPPGNQLAFSFLSQSTHYEYERVSVRSSGAVSLADGRTIDFSLELNMERESLLKESVTWQSAGRILMDPLTFNFDCDLRSLVNKSFQFDMNCDGSPEEFSSLAPGTGFLALDLNNDKQVNNGRELFGPRTGHGFSELAVHDLDRNGWIDENDPIFSKLRIWNPGTKGETELLSLKTAGVGAICLIHDTNKFQLKDMNNGLMGEVAATGVFLTEKGEVRPMQEIKLALHEQETRPAGLFTDQSAIAPRRFLQQMIAVQQEEVRALTRFRMSRRGQNEEDDLLTSLFPDWQKERGLSSVENRMRNRLLS
jgi:hypothetical protein